MRLTRNVFWFLAFTLILAAAFNNGAAVQERIDAESLGVDDPIQNDIDWLLGLAAKLFGLGLFVQLFIWAKRGRKKMGSERLLPDIPEKDRWWRRGI